MALKAIRDTIGIHTLATRGEPIELRQKVFAGDTVPPLLKVPDEDVEDSSRRQAALKPKTRKKVAR